MSRSIAELLKVAEPDRDMDWLEESLQSAVKLEFATIPLYLAALWSIKDPPGAAAAGLELALEHVLRRLRGAARDRRRGDAALRLGLQHAHDDRPRPGHRRGRALLPGTGLPGHVRPDLQVSLAGLTKERIANLFMQIEYPEYTVPDTRRPRRRRRRLRHDRRAL